MATLLALARDTKTQPLIWLFATLLAYRLCLTIQQKTKGHPLANPVGMAILLLVGVLWLTGTDYRTYFEGGRFIHLLLAGHGGVSRAAVRQFAALTAGVLANYAHAGRGVGAGDCV